MSTSWPNEDELAIKNIDVCDLTKKWVQVDLNENRLT